LSLNERKEKKNFSSYKKEGGWVVELLPLPDRAVRARGGGGKARVRNLKTAVLQGSGANHDEKRDETFHFPGERKSALGRM